MKTYSFTIKLMDVGGMTDEMVDAFYESGCSDGTYMLIGGTVKIGFDREAESLGEAVSSAILQVLSVVETRDIRISVEGE